MVWVAEVADRTTLTRLIRAALLHEVTQVRLSRTPAEKGIHTLQLRLGGEPIVVLSAEAKGRGSRGAFPLLLMPLDPSHIPELRAIVESGDDVGPPSVGPMSASASAIFDSEPPLPIAPPAPPAPPVPSSKATSQNRPFAKTIPDPEPEEIDDLDPEGEDLTNPRADEQLGPSVLFDPEGAIVAQAPAAARTGTDDTLTIPARASMIPPTTTNTPRSPRNKVDPDALETDRSAASPLLAGMSEARPTPRDANAPAPEPSEGTLIPVEHADPVTSQSNVHTQRRDGAWANDGPDADDASIGGSVVFDIDVLAREKHSRPSAPPPAPATIAEPAGSVSDSINVVFGSEQTFSNEKTSPQKPPAVSVRKDEDDTLTPTVPVDVPPKRPPSMRRDPSALVTEEGETLPINTESDRIPSHMPKPGTNAASSKKPGGPIPSSRRSARSRNDEQAPATAAAGPRTVKRNTAQMITGGRIIANRYRIETLVGAGAVGSVFKAQHVDLPRTFAIKLLHPHYRADPHLMASFRSEARAASLLDHPNVTVVHDFGEEPDGLVYIVMEYLQGINLQALLDEERKLSPRRAIEIMLQVCGALAAAHERGIVHRDVKPDNIMLVPTRDDEGRLYDLVKVCDFGIAALETAPGAEDGEITAGTPEYMAPEQAAGRADARTDVYACGIVLYEMVVGKPPFEGDTPIATLAKHAKERAKRPSEIIPGFPRPLEAIIMCAIEKQPERRFQTMRDLRAELKRTLSQLG